MKKVLVIVGPTGSGKTELSIRLAQALDTQIINGDSVQVYKGLDIGSAKIKPQEKQNIIHHLIDIVSPGEDYSVYHFQRDVRALILKLDLPLIVGGTGLYIKAALAQYEFVESSRNQDFESLYQNESNESLYQMLIFRDPDIKIDIQNRRRLLRALEQALSGELRSKKTEKDILLYDALVLYLDLDKTILEQRLKSRLDLQIEQGFIEEVRGFREKKIYVNAIGYRELNRYLDGTYGLDEAKDEIIMASKRLAKRQKTWFKNQMHPIMLDALSDTLFEDALKIIQTFLKEG